MISRRWSDRAARRRHTWAHASLSVLFWLGAAAEASAAPPPRVLVLDLDEHDLARRLRAELTFTGLAPVKVARALDADSTPNAEALVRVISERAVQIEIVDAEGHRTYSSTLRATRTETTTFAVRVVEQLRARLIDLGFELPAELPPETSQSDTRADATSSVVGATRPADASPVPTAASGGHDSLDAAPAAPDPRGPVVMRPSSCGGTAAPLVSSPQAAWGRRSRERSPSASIGARSASASPRRSP
jgi:hypothetical protein